MSDAVKIRCCAGCGLPRVLSGSVEYEGGWCSDGGFHGVTELREFIPRETIEKEVEAALDDLDRMPASIYFRDEGIAASYRERLDAARGRLSALLSDTKGDGPKLYGLDHPIDDEFLLSDTKEGSE